MAPSADDLPDCPECTNQESNPEQPSEIRRVTPQELAEWQSEVERIRTDGVRHAVDIVDLEGEYSTDEVQHCSYFDHPHRNGLLVFSRCGKLLKIGSHCGRKYIIGYGSLQRNLQRLRDLQAERELQRTEPKRLFESLSNLTARAEQRLEGLDALQEHTPQVHKALHRACIYTQPGVEVHVKRFDPNTGESREEHEHFEIQGLKLFRGLYSKEKLAEIRREASAFLRHARSVDLDHGNYRAFAASRRALREREEDLKQWLDDTARFWTEQNLELALIKTFDRLERVPGNLHRENRTLVLSAPERIVIGADGPQP